MKFELPPLSYSYDALEPYIDTRTMELHHAKHHQTYVNRLNDALADFPGLQEKYLEELLKSLDQLPEQIRQAVRNHGGGHFNHSLFWNFMRPPKEGGGGIPAGKIAEAINKKFSNFPKFKEQFTAAAVGLFGSGWVWLVSSPAEGLIITTTLNQDLPLIPDFQPLLNLDVWEHAYYLKYQNRRSEYIEAWWNIVNWDEVEKNFCK